MSGPLQGVKVVELGLWVAAPSAAAMMCDWGATVIKIEPPNGDPFRGLFASLLGTEASHNPPFERRTRRNVNEKLSCGWPLVSDRVVLSSDR